jgi:hypothetical protein
MKSNFKSQKGSFKIAFPSEARLLPGFFKTISENERI